MTLDERRQEPTCVAVRVLPNGRIAEVMRATYGKAKLCLVNVYCDYSYDSEW